MSNACAEGESTFPLSTAAWPAPRHTLLFAWGFCAAGILSRPAAVLSNWSLFPPKPTPHPPTSGCRGTWSTSMCCCQTETALWPAGSPAATRCCTWAAESRCGALWGAPGCNGGTRVGREAGPNPRSRGLQGLPCNQGLEEQAWGPTAERDGCLCESAALCCPAGGAREPCACSAVPRTATPPTLCLDGRTKCRQAFETMHERCRCDHAIIRATPSPPTQPTLPHPECGTSLPHRRPCWCWTTGRAPTR